MTDVNTSAFKQFADNWQKALSSSGSGTNECLR